MAVAVVPPAQVPDRPVAAVAGPEQGVAPPAVVEPLAGAEPLVEADPLEGALLVAAVVVGEVLGPPPPPCSRARWDHTHFLLDFLVGGIYEFLWACPLEWGKHPTVVAIPPTVRFLPHPSKYQTRPAGYAVAVPGGRPWLPHAMEISNLYGNF